MRPEAALAAACEEFWKRARSKPLRVCDKHNGRHRQYGLRILTERVDSSGPDYLICPTGARIVVARSLDEVVAAYEISNGEPYFVELKAPEARPRKNEAAQNRWIQLIRRRER